MKKGPKSVRHAYHTIGWPTIEEALAGISASGYQGFEAFSTVARSDVGAFRELCQTYGLQLAALYQGVHLLDPTVVPDETDEAVKAAAWLARLDADRLVVGGGDRRSSGNTLDDYRHMAAALNEIGSRCLDHGVLVCYHPHWGSAVESASELDLLMDLTDPRYVFLAPDTAHLLVGGSDPAAVVRQYASRVRYIHLKDVSKELLPRITPGQALREIPYGYFRPLGEGALDLPGILGELRRQGYSGWLTVELDWSDDPEESARASLAYLDKAWNESG